VSKARFEPAIWHQVVKKWLSYRERDVLGRALKPDEVQEVASMIRRIVAIVLLSPALDANYERVKANAAPIKKESALL